MFIRKYWILLLVLIVAIVGVGLYYLQTRPPKDPIVIITPVEPLEKPTAETPVVEQTPQGHVHEDGTLHAEPRETPQPSTDARDTPEPVASPAPMETLTYHTELLDRHPVEALRQQGKERGHWSADHIPPFPPDDKEAADFARNTYIVIYYWKTGQTDHPDYLPASKAKSNFRDALSRAYDAGFKTPWEAARNNDLMKITWANIPPLDLPHPWTTTFTLADGINPQSARPLFPFELEMTLR